MNYDYMMTMAMTIAAATMVMRLAMNMKMVFALDFTRRSHYGRRKLHKISYSQRSSSWPGAAAKQDYSVSQPIRGRSVQVTMRRLTSMTPAHRASAP